ncbi:MAG: HAD-IA family hydrolase [Chitinispirillaceae bacterium]|jgi:phosphoglycolate phosphatase-like HAD superfamily hydrolase
MISVLLFDFDGTIADTFDLAMVIGEKIADVFGIRQVTKEEVVHFRNAPLKEAIRDLKVPLRKMPAMLLRIRQEIHENIGRVCPVKGIADVLKEARSCCGLLGIVSSNSEENVAWFLKHYNLDFFDIGAYSSAVFGKLSKLRGLIHRHHLQKEHILYVGDTIGDIEACRKAGIRVAAVTWGYNTKESLEAANPDFLVTKPEELLNIIKTENIK